MKELLINSPIFFCFLCLLFFSGCGNQSELTGIIVDAETNNPIEGAVVVINWYKYPWYDTVIGLGKGEKKFGVYEAISDSKGNFKSYKHSGAEYHMCVYKNGYICWYSDYIFNPQGEPSKDLWIKREKHRLYNNIIIKLKPFRYDNLINEHAEFLIYAGSSCEGKELLGEATLEEIIKYENYRMKNKK